MKKILFLMLFILPLIVNAQSKDIKEIFERYTDEKVYTIDKDNIVVSAVIDNIDGTKDDIYIKVKNYFTRAYGSANSVLQTDDKEAGVIIGKGLYKDVYVFKPMGVINTRLNVYHILRIDIKDNKIRVICSANTWDDCDSKGSLDKTVKILDNAPFTDKRFFDKGKQMIATVNLIDLMKRSVEDLEESIREGGLSIENDNW